MDAVNVSLVTEFILVGLTEKPELQIPLFFLFLAMYLVTALGNLCLIILTVLNSHLHTPMYFFLFNLSFIDLCYCSVFTPQMLMNFVLREKVISYMECMTQVYFFCFFVVSECYVLTSMAYDRYMAICNPLLYNVVMSPKLCLILMFGSYFIALSNAVANTACMLKLTFCDANIINHYFCDVPPLLQLSCTSTDINELVLLVVGTINIIVPTSTILSPMVSSFSASFKLVHQKEGPKPSTPAVLTSLLFLCSLVQVHLSISNPLQEGLWKRGNFLLSFILTLFP